MTYSPTRRFLGMAAWKWLLVPLFVGILALTFGRPGPLEPHKLVVDMVESPNWVRLTKNEKSFQLVPHGEEEERFLTPSWRVTLLVQELVPEEERVQWQFGWADGQFILGLFMRYSETRYSLALAHLDSDTKKEIVRPIKLFPIDSTKILPDLIADLNRRFPEEQRGTKLKELLENGLRQKTPICWQNFMIVLVWLSVLLALAALGSMLVQEEKGAEATAETKVIKDDVS